MAYYDDGYMWAQEHTPYDPLAYRDSVSFSGYEPYGVDTSYNAYNVFESSEPKIIDHSNYGCDFNYDYRYGYDYDYHHNWYPSTNPAINYFAQNYVEPKLIAYEPIECDTGYISYHTQYSISYSEKDSGFNEPEFEEYDPTPYGGGYDIVSVYGKPLPPSDQTCYPLSKPKALGPKPTPNPQSQPDTKSEPEPIHKPEPTPVHVPVHVTPPTCVPTPIPLVNPEPEPEPEPEHVLVPLPEPLALREEGEREREEYCYPNYGYDYPWPEYDHGNGTGVGYVFGYGKQVVQIPPFEYSPEVVDLCENIFGNWPCLARIRKQQLNIDNDPGITCPKIRHHNPWEECADYIFGRPIASYNK